MNNFINSSNNELEILKTQGPFRINNTDNSDFNSVDWKEVIFNEPIIIGYKELAKKMYEERPKEIDGNDLIINEMTI